MLEQLRESVRRDEVFSFLKPSPSPLLGKNLDTSHGPILYLEDITVEFDGFKALNNLTLTIDDGELRCIIGPNGAGKTTMMDVITGKTRPDSGLAYFGQTIDLTKLQEYEIAQVGIGRKFQKPTVFPNHTAFENLELALDADKRTWPSLRFSLTAEQKDSINETLEYIGLLDCSTMLGKNLSHGQKQWLEIGMVMMQKPRLLLIDEPIAGMTHQETEKTAELLLKLAGDQSVVVVEHDMQFVRSIANKVTVLHEGSVLAEGSMSEVQNNQKVIEVYLGE